MQGLLVLYKTFRASYVLIPHLIMYSRLGSEEYKFLNALVLPGSVTMTHQLRVPIISNTPPTMCHLVPYPVHVDKDISEAVIHPR
jgi:hypothetical protein